MKISKIRKALVAVGGAVVAVAGVLGTNIDPSVVSSVVGVITSILVYVVPND